MTYGKGLLRAWGVVSVLWIAAAGNVFLRQYARCCKTPLDDPYHPVRGLPGEPMISMYAHDLVVTAAFIVGLPLALLATGIVFAWIGRGFRG